MSKKKAETKQVQNTSYANTNTYGHVATPETADIAAVRNFKFNANPSTGYAFGNAKNQIANSFNNPIGGVYSGNMRDNILRSATSDLAQKESQAKSEDYSNLQGQNFAQKSLVAGLTMPKFVQTGGSGTGTSTGNTTQTQSGGLAMDLLTAGAMGAGA